MQPGRSLARRSLVAMIMPLMAGCGLQPVYRRSEDEQESAAATGLAQVAIGLIPERQGQLLRNALQERFERAGVVTPRKYDLTVSYSFSSEGVGIRQDYSASRIRFIGRATYTLITQDATRATLTSGTARVLDGLDAFNEQYFASDLETETIQRRVAEAIADQIALQLAGYFRKRAIASAR